MSLRGSTEPKHAKPSWSEGLHFHAKNPTRCNKRDKASTGHDGARRRRPCTEPHTPTSLRRGGPGRPHSCPRNAYPPYPPHRGQPVAPRRRRPAAAIPVPSSSEPAADSGAAAPPGTAPAAAVAPGAALLALSSGAAAVDDGSGAVISG